MKQENPWHLIKDLCDTRTICMFVCLMLLSNQSFNLSEMDGGDNDVLVGR